MKNKRNILKRAIIPILVLALCLVSSVVASAADSYIEGQKYTYNGTEYTAERPAGATVTTHVYYVGGAKGSDTNNGLTRETPFATIAGAVTYAQSLGYISDVDYTAAELHEVKLVLVGDTTETKTCPQLKGGILTIVPDNGVDVTVTIGTSTTTVSGTFFLMKPDSKSTGKYMELNLGAMGMNGTITFDGTYYNINAGNNQGTWGGFVRIGDESYTDVAIANMYDGVTVENIGYDETTGTVVKANVGHAIQIDCGTFNMYGGKFTQNACSTIIGSYGRSGAGAYIHGGEITNNNAAPLNTYKTSNAKIVVYDCFIDNNVAGGWGAVDCSATGSTMIIYGGTISNNIGTDKKKQICANGNFYISDSVIIDNGVCNTLDGRELTVGGTYECNNHFDMVSTVIYAKDGSALAYGYCSSKATYFKNGDTIENFDGCNIAVSSSDYVYSEKNTTSCLYRISGISSIDISESMTSAVYYFSGEMTHNYVLTEVQLPTATEDGYYRYTCSDCGNTYDEIIESTGCEHNFVSTDVPVTCTTDGYTLHKCSICNLEVRSDIIPQLGHDYIIDELKATCLTAGYKDVTCSRCDYHDHEDYAKLEHAYTLEKTYPSLLYRCVNGCNQKTEKTYISYHKDLTNWSSDAAKDFTLEVDNNVVRYTAEVTIGQTITVGQTLEGEDIKHQNDSGNKKFFGWYTDQGEVFEYGDEITIEGNMVFYEAYGYEVDSSNYMNYKGWVFLRLTSDIEPTSPLGFDQNGGVGVIDLNGHNITFKSEEEGKQYSKRAFDNDRQGVILVGEGVITHNSSNTARGGEFMKTHFHGYGDSDTNKLVHTLWIGKNVTVNTTGALFYYDNNGKTTPIIKIAGTVNAKSICDVTPGVGATVEIYPSANITLTDNTKLSSTSSTPVQVNIYGGNINFPDGIEDMETYLVPTERLYKYQISGGTFNVAIPEKFVYSENELFHNDTIDPRYFVIMKCPDGTHTFAKYSDETVCAQYKCSCGVSIGGHIGHVFGGIVTSISYPNGFGNFGDNKCLCTVCQLWEDTEEGVAEPIFRSLGYSAGSANTAIYGGFYVNLDALNAYNSYLEEGKELKYGIIVSNVTGLTSLTIGDGTIDNTKSVMAEIKDHTLNRIGIAINGLDPTVANHVNLQIVISVYVIDENDDITFVQKDGAMDGSYYTSGITVNETENALGAITLKQMAYLSNGVTLEPAQTPKEEGAA
ncbi:MAG: hypothetical protein ACI3XS_01335 [Eubacteriales bacterium]